MTDPVRQSYVDSHRSVAQRLPGSAQPWLRRVREAGLSRFNNVGFPTLRDEDWKYTDVRVIAKQPFLPVLDPGDGVDGERLRPLSFAGLESHRCVFVNGHYAPHLSALGTLADGIVVDNLATVLNQQPRELEGELGRSAPGELHGFAALNTAYLMDGAYVRLGRNCELELPIELIYVSTGTDDNRRVTYPRNLIIAESGSRAVIVERFVGLGQNRYLTSAITEVIAGPSAHIDYYKLQEESQRAYHVHGLYLEQARDSAVTTNNIALGAAIARTDIQVSLAAPGTCSKLNGLYIGTGKQHIDNHTQVDHRSPHCISDEFYKGVLDGRARAVFHGRVVVHQDAQHTDAQQQNKNLLLSPNAEVDTKPQLEIYADDVKCSHGATVGQLDPDAIFYLRSRALDESTARNLLTYAFANDVINRFALDPIRRAMEGRLVSKLLHGQQLEDLA